MRIGWESSWGASQSCIPDANLDDYIFDANLDNCIYDANLDNYIPDANLVNYIPDANLDNYIPDANLDNYIPDANLDNYIPDANLDVENYFPDANLDNYISLVFFSRIFIQKPPLRQHFWILVNFFLTQISKIFSTLCIFLTGFQASSIDILYQYGWQLIFFSILLKES